MAELNKLDTAALSEIAGLRGSVISLRNTAKTIKNSAEVGEGLPIPDLNKIVKDKLEAEKIKYIDELQRETLLFLTTALSEFIADNPPPVDEIVDKINPVIDRINSLISEIKSAVDRLIDITTQINTVVTTVLVLYISTRIIALIPAPTVGLGAGVSFTSFITFCQDINRGVATILRSLATITFSILSVILMLLNLFSFIGMVVGIISNFLNDMMSLLNGLIYDSLKTADDWANSANLDDDGSETYRNNKDDNINTDERRNLMNQINELEFDINSGLVSCQFSDGTIEKLSPEECLARGGTILDDSIDLSNLKNLLSGLGGPLSDNNQIITSLLNLNKDVTVEDATKKKGKRYGFYQTDIKNDRRN
jgi:hypothetical protein